MNKGGMFFATLLLLFGGTTMAQHLSHQVLVPAAGIGISPSATISQSIGENAVILLSSYENDVTQGFQQPRIKLIPIDQPQGTGVEVYPIPATEWLNVELFGADPMSYSITVLTISGRIVYSTKIDFQDSYWYVHNIAVGSFVKGLYLVRVRSSKGNIDRTFKITVI